MRTVIVMFTSELTVALIGAVIGALAGAPLAVVAARRAVSQPVEFDTDRERTLLAWVLNTPTNIVKVLELRPEHFADRRHTALWDVLVRACADVPRLGPDADDAAQVAAAAHVPTDLVEQARVADPELVTDLLVVDVNDVALNGLAAAQYVYDAGRDRLTYPGNSPIEAGNEGEPALVRRYRSPRLLRYLTAALLGASAGAVAPLLAERLWPSGAAYWFALAALAVLGVGSIIWALVDQDTMLIDLETFFPLAGTAWALTIAAGFAGGEPRRAFAGFLLSVSIAVFFRLVNAAYRRFKAATTGVAVDGMGGGDSWLVIATAGVPAALAGQLNLWYLCAMAGMVAAIVVWIVRFPTPWRISRGTPFAFGPYLALGWILGSAAYLAGVQIL